MTEKPHPKEASSVLSQAVVTIAQRMGMSDAQLSRIRDSSPCRIARLHEGQWVLDEQESEWPRAQLLVRLFTALVPLVGDDESAKLWINGENRGLGGRPVDLVCDADWLTRVVQYVENHLARP